MNRCCTTCRHDKVYEIKDADSDICSLCYALSKWECKDELKMEYKKPEIIEGPIKDSGERTLFSTGAVRDMSAGKGRMDLLPWPAIMRVSRHCENGAMKYGERNVDKGIPQHSFIDSAFRHLAKYNEGLMDEDHLAAAAWNILFAMNQEEKEMYGMLDLPWQVMIREAAVDNPYEDDGK